MPRFGRITWLVPVAVVLGVGVWIASGATINAARLKAELQRSVLRATGRPFTIDGDLHIAMGLSPTVTAQDITLANVPGGSAPSMLRAATLHAQVALLPLLNGRVVLQDVSLQGADLLFENGPDGRPNWQFQVQRRPLIESSDSGSAPHAGGSLDVHTVRLQDGHLTWRLAPDRAVTVAISDAEIRADGVDGAMRGEAHGSAYGVPFAVTANAGSFARLQGGPVTALAGTWALNVAMSAADATLRIDGGVNHPDEWRGYAFLVTGNAPDLSKLAAWLPAPLALPLRDVNFTTRVSDGSNGVFRTAALSLHAGAADLGASLPGLSLREAVFSAPGPGQQAQFSVDGSYQGAPLRLAGTTTQPDILSGNVPLPLTLSAQAGTANLSARGTVPPSLTANGFDLTLELRTPNLADLSGLVGRKLPDIRDVMLGAHVGDAGFRLRGIDLRDLALESSIGDLAGNLTVAWAPVITLTGTLTSKRFDADAAWDSWEIFAASPPPGQVTTGVASPAPSPATVLPANILPFGALRGADGDLTMALDSFVAGGETYRDVHAKLVAADGRIVVNPLRLTAPQGVVIGGLTVDASASPPQLAVSFRAPGLAAAKVSSLFGYPGGASGQLQVDAQLSAAGASAHELAAGLDGHLGLSLVNGSVSDALLQSALGSALSRAGVPALGGDVAVRCFASRTNFSHGRGDVQVLALDTPQMTLDGDGTIDMGPETVALHLRPLVRVGGTAVAAPVSLSGSFGDLHAALDPVSGRVGISIGGPAPSGDPCVAKLATARGGMPGPMPAAVRAQGAGPIKKPTDLLRGLFHH
jgi:AsmA protein